MDNNRELIEQGSPLICRICDDIARGMNFDVITCMSCKAFFRRNAFLLDDRRCERKNYCNITKETRGNCSACRLRKCYAFGMNPSLIRSATQSGINPNKFEQLIMKKKTRFRLPTPAPLDLLQHDRSTLSSKQWNLLSNIICSYDEQNQIIRIKQLFNAKSSLLPKLRTKTADTLNIFNKIMTGIQPIIDRSPHFQSLSNNTRRLLISNNIVITGGVNAVFVSREANAFENEAYVNACTLVYGSDFVMSFVQRNVRLEANGNLIKLLIFVLIFSSNCSIVLFTGEEDIEITASTSIELFRIQNIYINILWKYLVYLYGDNQAVIRFSSLIRAVLDAIEMGRQVIENLAHNALIDRIMLETERSLTITN